VQSAKSSQVICLVGSNTAGILPIKISTLYGQHDSEITYEGSILGSNLFATGLGGGNEVMLSGTGFPSGIEGAKETVVMLAGISCKVVSSSWNSLTCVAGPSDSSVTGPIKVAVNGVSFTSDFSFEYNAAITPRISSVYPLTGSAFTRLTITGTGFDESSKVTVGTETCDVIIRENQQIICRVAAQPPNDLAVRVHTNNGFSVGPTIFSYLLSVTSVEPKFGSIFGGNLITIKGQGFGESKVDANVV
jgi:hypothetical protein